MAGGKETPRQKMIGMMYLVLTALLALNVSKSILDAFVAIEENVQTSSLAELLRGDEKKSEIAQIAADKTNPERAKKATILKSVIDDIDVMTAKRIKYIDDLKLEILIECGEDVETVGENISIIQSKYDATNDPLKPIRMNLDNVEAKDKYDEAMNLLIGENIKAPNKKGMELWNQLNSYRKELSEKIANSQVTTKGDDVIKNEKYSLTVPTINTFESQADLTKKIKDALSKGSVHPDDEATIIEVYRSLTKQEYSEVHDVEGVHWIGKTFDHSPSVAALASLSSLQKEILAARANAINLVRGRVTGDFYSFNTILPLAIGPEVVNVNEKFEVKVMMGAYDSDLQPEVTLEGQTISNVKDGQGIIEMTGNGSQMELKGTVSIKNKAGIKKTIPWTKNITVMKPSGSIELPQLNILYRNYDNIVTATASGYESTVLTGTDVNLTKSGNEYIARTTGNSRTAYLSVSGKTSDGRVVQLKRVKYKVSNLPRPTVYWGNVRSGGTGTPQNKKLFIKLGPEIPLNIDYTMTSWEVDAGGIRNLTGAGNTLTAEAIGLIRAAKSSGKSVTFFCKYKKKGSSLNERINGSFRL